MLEVLGESGSTLLICGDPKPQREGWVSESCQPPWGAGRWLLFLFVALFISVGIDNC